MARSFVDTDLLEPDDLDTGDIPAENEDGAERLARQKEQIAEQVADAAEEIERLQMRQKELEQARHALRELHRKQHAYEEGKKVLIEKLNRESLLLEKEDVRLTRALELVTATRRDFDGMLRELREIREDRWSESGFEEELDTVLALLDSMRGVYSKSTARLDAQGICRGPIAEERSDGGGRESVTVSGGWGFWFRAGIALAFCMGLMGAILLSLFLYLR